MRTVFCIAILLISFSCKKDRLFGDKKILVGTWNWQSSEVLDYCSGGGSYLVYSPETEVTFYKIVFLKKGIIQLYQDETLLNEHKIKFEKLYIQKNGIVPSHKEISFLILLDGDSEKNLSGKGTPNAFTIRGFPFEEEEDCVSFAFNYFKKE